jgi:hypothetical protein
MPKTEETLAPTPERAARGQVERTDARRFDDHVEEMITDYESAIALVEQDRSKRNPGRPRKNSEDRSRPSNAFRHETYLGMRLGSRLRARVEANAKDSRRSLSAEGARLIELGLIFETLLRLSEGAGASIEKLPATISHEDRDKKRRFVAEFCQAELDDLCEWFDVLYRSSVVELPEIVQSLKDAVCAHRRGY